MNGPFGQPMTRRQREYAKQRAARVPIVRDALNRGLTDKQIAKETGFELAAVQTLISMVEHARLQENPALEACLLALRKRGMSCHEFRRGRWRINGDSRFDYSFAELKKIAGGDSSIIAKRLTKFHRINGRSHG